MTVFTPGTLWDRIITTGRQAIASGSLLSIPTDQAVIEQSGVRFLVRVLAGLRRKDDARKEQDAAARAGKPVNPFLPTEPALTIGRISDTHIAVLNKFNVVDHRLLIVTAAYEDQETLLTPADWNALWT